ncbi:MAG: DUF5691 domain-containing protein [Myxococcaceae bacterium]|nr:DUF5691 domain-containing protein [Myxococcaceae bacterium]MCI0673801.1 DUF5691 domain-containing protein [Myxococcaceae bacterium]
MKGLVELALLGTGRGADGDARTGTRVDALVAAATVESAEWRLLLAAGAEAVYRQAGIPPFTSVAPPAPARSETRPACSPRAAAALREVLREHRELLPQALERLAQMGQRLAPALLPEVLALKSLELRDALVPVLGERGVWLAEQNSEWAWVLARAQDDTAERARRWEEGHAAERLAALRREREVSPGRARSWLEGVWKQEKADQRATFLEALEVGLKPTDEPFLEGALDDRSQAVRAAASALLGRLPESRLARRMRERVDALMSFTPPATTDGSLWGVVKARLHGESPAGVLHVEPPASLPREWERDGITARPRQGLGERAHWLVELVARVAPSQFEERFGATPAQLVRAAAASEWSLALALGWSQSVVASPSPGWAEPLWDFWLEAPAALTQVEGAPASFYLHALLAHMPEARAEERALQLLERAGPRPVSLHAVVKALPGPWSPGTAERYLKALARRLAGTAADAFAWQASLDPAALALPLASIPHALALIEDAEPARLEHGWARALHTFESTLRLRQRLHEEIAP